MKMASYKLVDLFFTLCMEVLELMEISLHIQPIGCQDVRLPLDQVFTLLPSNLTDSGEHMSQVG